MYTKQWGSKAEAETVRKREGAEGKVSPNWKKYNLLILKTRKWVFNRFLSLLWKGRGFEESGKAERERKKWEKWEKMQDFCSGAQGAVHDLWIHRSVFTHLLTSRCVKCVINQHISSFSIIYFTWKRPLKMLKIMEAEQMSQPLTHWGPSWKVWACFS